MRKNQSLVGFARRLASHAGLAGVLAAGVLAATATTAGAQQKEVVLAGYGGTIERFTRGNLIPAFEKATGIKVTLVVGTAMGNFTKVQAAKDRPDIDVYWSNELTHTIGKQQGLYEKLDPAVVTNIDQVFEEARDPDGVGVVSGITTTGIIYNDKAMAEAGVPVPKAWSDLADPRYKGKIAMYDFNVAYSQDLLVILSKLNGGSEDNVQPGVAKLKALRESGNLAHFVRTPAELDNMIIQGTAWMTVNGGIRAFLQQEKGAPMGFVYPSEGAGFFANYFDVVKNAPHPEAAQILVNYLISAEAQEIISGGMFVAPVNRNVNLSEEHKKRVNYGAENLKKLIRIDRAKMNANLDKWAELWRREVMGN
ncbi:ABC transporter substrate-binding protein [Thalassobaculum sp.]|uniref:ABC transporter substrate-binding protein n=1 Tax=Thalassobaculum sp. TaxID=2022740 RepID=UPI0032EFC0BD